MWLCVIAVTLVQSDRAWADAINLGFISFDGFIPASSGSPGVNEFSINDLTGDPALGGFALPPDFNVLTFVTFKNAQLALDEPSGSMVIALGDLGPGTTIRDLISGSTDLLSATFSATLNETTLSLSGGGIFTAGSPLIEAVISPSSAQLLAAGDFSLIAVSSVPEPASGPILLVGTLAVILRRNRKQRIEAT
jgi:hypothetical protein